MPCVVVMLAPGSILNLDWLESHEGRDMIGCIYNRNRHRPKTFGLLERPPLAGHVEEARYKLFVSGKSGVGKTSCIAKITGNVVPRGHCETSGIQTTTTYWPGKVSDLNKVVLFRLQFWDAGEGALKKFDHILPACTDKADAVLFLFSVVDRASFEELHQQISRLSTPNDNTVKLVIATKCDQHPYSEVTQRDIRDFEHTWKIPVVKVKSVPETNSADSSSDTVNILNTICEHLWYRDLVLAGKLQRIPQLSVKNSSPEHRDEYV